MKTGFASVDVLAPPDELGPDADAAILDDPALSIVLLVGVMFLESIERLLNVSQITTLEREREQKGEVDILYRNLKGT